MQANSWIATKLAHDGSQKSPHPRCAQGQGQGQRSRDTGTSVMSRNVRYTVRSHVLCLHALTLWNTIILFFQYKYQAARCLNIGMSYSVIDALVIIINAVLNMKLFRFRFSSTEGVCFGLRLQCPVDVCPCVLIFCRRLALIDNTVLHKVTCYCIVDCKTTGRHLQPTAHCTSSNFLISWRNYHQTTSAVHSL